jgi:hypothetical protein
VDARIVWNADADVDALMLVTADAENLARQEPPDYPPDCPCRDLPRWAELLLIAVALANIVWIGWMAAYWFCRSPALDESASGPLAFPGARTNHLNL